MEDLEEKIQQLEKEIKAEQIAITIAIIITWAAIGILIGAAFF